MTSKGTAMKLALLLTPILFVSALSAQVPARPPVAPVPPTPPRPAVAPYVSVTPWPDVIPAFGYDFDSKFNFDMSPLDSYAYAFDDLKSAFSNLTSVNAFGGWGQGGPVAWAQDDPADSLYRQARDQFNRGDYRKAAELFKSLPQRYTNSVYIADAQYYQAFSLYRIGGTAELQEALAVLEARKPSPPGDRQGPRAASTSSGGGVSVGVGTGVNTSVNTTVTTSVGAGRYYEWASARGGNNDAAGLAARIANVLSARGLANDAAVKRALAAGGNSCDQEDQSVKAEALSALMQNDPETGRQMAIKILANKDECSVPLRRNAVMLVGNKHDDAAANTLIPVAKSDPSPSVRMAALEYLIRVQTDVAVNAVIDAARSSDDKQVQRAALRALAQSTNARARTEIRTLVENNAGDESLRVSVIDGLDRDRMTAEDATWLRGLYGKSTSARVKERIVSAVSRAGGDVNNQWLLALVRNDDESLDSRTTALERVGRTMDVVTLAKMYDASSQGPIRRTVMDLLSERKEPEALDKIVEIARSGTDVEMRRHAINILSRSKDPRASKLLLQLVDH
jgi:HEAT repeat protein